LFVILKGLSKKVNLLGREGEQHNDLYSANAFLALQNTKYLLQHTTHLAQYPKSPIFLQIDVTVEYLSIVIRLLNFIIIIRAINLIYRFFINLKLAAHIQNPPFYETMTHNSANNVISINLQTGIKPDYHRVTDFCLWLHTPHK
jgi:hypothetical protein